MLNHPCIPGMRSIWLWWMIFMMCCWIWFAIISFFEHFYQPLLYNFLLLLRLN
jgi:hypothetical protein